MTNAFSRSWEVTKLTFDVIREDKELILFPILSGIFSLLFIIAMIFPFVISSIAEGITKNSLTSSAMLIVYFIIYLGLAFIATFFNVCVVYTAKTRFKGKNATFGESIKFAFSKLNLILAWSLLAATIGLILRILDSVAEKSEGIGRWVMHGIVSLLGAAWSIITIFVVPGMVYNNLGPINAIKKSVQVLKKTWGESLIKYFALGLTQFLFIIAGIIITIILLILGSGAGIVGIIFAIIIAVLYFVAVITIFSVANTVFNTALYVYAETGKVPGKYTKDIMSNAFASRKRK